MARRNWDSTAFLDLLFNALLGFVFLFIVAFALVEVDRKQGDIKTKAEFVITVTWDLDNSDDVDTWLQDPADATVWFQNKEMGLMHLDRDDLGNKNDTYHLPDGTTVQYPYNQEITTIRGIIPGMWILNLHMYNKRRPEPANVNVEMVKLNPSHRVIFVKDFVMEKRGQEVTVCRFEMNPGGEIVSMDELKTSVAGDHLGSSF